MSDTDLARARHRSRNPFYRWGLWPIPIDPNDYLGNGELYDIGAGRVYIESIGDGKDIIMLPGFAGSSRSFRAIAKELQDDYRVHLCDFLGSGLSDKPQAVDHSWRGQARQVDAIMKALELKKAILIANSGSSMTSIFASFRSPRRFEALVLISPFLVPSMVAGWGAKLAGNSFCSHLMPLVLGSRFAVKFANYLGHYDKSVINDHTIDEQYLALGSPGFWGSLKKSARYLYPAGVRGIAQMIEIPTLAITAEADRACDLDGTQELISEMSRGRLELVTDCGHMIHAERPAYAVRLIREFLSAESEKIK